MKEELPPEKLERLQAMSLKDKVRLTKKLITEWYESWDGNVSVCFSGGKDSTVLLNLVRSIYPHISAVFSNTGLEYPEIVSFVKKQDNIKIVRPKKTFEYVIKKYGYPIISKENAHKIYGIRNTKSEKLLHKRLYGANNKYKSGKLPNKWHFLINAPFKISEKCCYHLKIYPMSKVKNPFTGNMAIDSHARKQIYLRNKGCGQLFSRKKPQSHPMYFWNDNNVWEYIRSNNIPYSKIYDMGYDRTGCMFCMFGVHLEEEPNRFQKMQLTHPKQWNYCIYKLDLQLPLDFIKVCYIHPDNYMYPYYKQTAINFK